MDVRCIFRAPTLASILVALIPIYTVSAEEPDLAQLKRTLAERIPDQSIVDIRPAAISGLYEVFTGPSMYYSDSTGSYVVYGSLMDTRTKTDLTDATINKRNAIRFETLPFDKAIRVVKGDGSRKLAVFTDPDCPYCKRLEEEMKSVSNVTMYLFMFPLKQIHPNAEKHAKAIWCSADPAHTWGAWMLEHKEPATKVCDNDPIESNLQLGEKLNISGTPTIYFEDGGRQVGAPKSSDLETRMNKAKKI